MATRRKPTNRYELFTCAWKGHALVGDDVASVTPDDRMLAREAGAMRWLRCIRCDAWIPSAVPDHPTRDSIPPREEIDLPDRGPKLRDKYVLRLIALDRATHVIVLTALAIALFTFANHHTALQRDYNQIMDDLSGGDPGASSVRGLLGHFRNAFHYSPRHLVELGLVLLAYAALEATEMVGLWFAKRWAEYLTFVATILLVPFEVYELTNGVSAFKVITLIINLAIVVYLLLAKRLFGLRGGHKVVIAQRKELGGWVAIERATPGGGLPA